MWYVITCKNGVVNEIPCSTNAVVSCMMDALETEGYKWVDYVSAESEMCYTVEKRR